MNEIRPGNYPCIKPSRLATPTFVLRVEDLNKLDEQGRGSEPYNRLSQTICPDCRFSCLKGGLLNQFRKNFPLPDEEEEF